MSQGGEALAMQTLIDDLTVQFPDVPSATVIEVVTAAHHRFDGRPIRAFVPIFVGREARDRLRA